MSTTSISSEKLSGNVARLVDRLSKDLSVTNAKSEVQLRRPGNGVRKSIARFEFRAGHTNTNSLPKTALVRYSYQAQQEDELCLAEGDLIEVIEEVEDGWMRGRLHERVGLFPTNFVKFNNGLSTNNNVSNTYASSALSKINERVNDENVAGEIVATERVDKPTNMLPAAYKASRRVMSTIVSSSTDVSPPVTTIDPSKPKEFAKVLYEYTAAHPDELSLKEGNIVLVLNKKCEDDGWFEGELNSKRGLFPENFVKLLPVTTESKPSPPLSTPPVLPVKPKAAIGQHMSASGPVPSAENERKSVVADLQSKLFPAGFPTKPPASSKQTTSAYTTTESQSVRSAEKPPTNSDNDKLLSNPTKSRPKQNKRPPSNIRQITAKKSEENHATAFPAKEQVPSKEVNKYDFPPSTIPSIPPNMTKIEPISVAKPILTPSNVIQKTKTSHSSTTTVPLSTTVPGCISSNESEFVSRAEYNALWQKVERLEKTIEDLHKKIGQ